MQRMADLGAEIIKIEHNIKAAYNLDKPLPQQYLIYLGKLAHGDLGPSFKNKDFTVAQLIATGLPVSARLGLCAMALALFLGHLGKTAPQVPQGPVAPTYTGGGGGHDLMKVGAMFAGDLSGVKTRVLLAVLLGAGLSPEEIRQGVESRGL